MSTRDLELMEPNPIRRFIDGLRKQGVIPNYSQIRELGNKKGYLVTILLEKSLADEKLGNLKNGLYPKWNQSPELQKMRGLSRHAVILENAAKALIHNPSRYSIRVQETSPAEHRINRNGKDKLLGFQIKINEK